MGRLCCVPREIAAHSPRNELVENIVAPLLEYVATQSPLDPLLKLFEPPVRLAEPKVGFPAEHVFP